MQSNYDFNGILHLGNFFTPDRVSVIFLYFFFGIISNLIYIISILLMLFMFFYGGNKTNLSNYYISLVLNFLLILSFYIFTSYPLEWHLKVSIERVLFEVMGIYIIPIIIFINVYSKKIFKIQ